MARCLIETSACEGDQGLLEFGKAPSSDIVKPPAKKLDRRRKTRRGGQQGHKKQVREPLLPERVDEQITYESDAADIRARELAPTDDFEIGQHIEWLGLLIHATGHLLR